MAVLAPDEGQFVFGAFATHLSRAPVATETVTVPGTDPQALTPVGEQDDLPGVATVSAEAA